MTRTFRQLFEETLAVLRKARADHMFVGAIGVMAWGEPRATGDVDLVLGVDAAGARSVLDGLRRRGLAVKSLTFRHWVAEVPGSRLAVDIFLKHRREMVRELDAVERRPFESWIRYDEAAFRRRVRQRVGGTSIWVAAPEDIIIVKTEFSKDPRRFGSDQADICSILLRQGARLDRRYLARWLRSLGLEKQFARIERGCL